MAVGDKIAQFIDSATTTPLFQRFERVYQFFFCSMLLRKFFLRANKVEVRPKGEDSLAGEKAGREGEGRRKKEKVTDSPRARKRQQVSTYDVIMMY